MMIKQMGLRGLRSAAVAMIALSAIALRPAGLARADLPVRPDPGLPERPASAVERDPGGYIALTIDGAAGEYWTEVQWGDGAGRWYPVEGWRTTTAVGRVTWFVREADFGKGPFRWRVHRGEGGGVVATSAAFDLPRARGERVETRVPVHSP